MTGGGPAPSDDLAPAVLIGAPGTEANEDAAEENLVVNGSFERFHNGVSREEGRYFDSHDVPGWTIQADGDPLQFVTTGAGLIPTDGRFFIDMNSYDSPVTISQVLSLDSGVEYRLVFDIWTHLQGALDVYFAGALIGNLTPFSVWNASTFTLTGGAGDGSNILTFRGIGDGTVLDNVEVVVADQDLIVIEQLSHRTRHR